MKAQGKKFLTDRGDEGGSVRWSVSLNATDDYGLFNPFIEAELILTDCYKSINLEFNCYKARHIGKRIAKLDVLIQELGLFRVALVQAQLESKPKKFCY